MGVNGLMVSLPPSYIGLDRYVFVSASADILVLAGGSASVPQFSIGVMKASDRPPKK